jgi:hypothetical protein
LEGHDQRLGRYLGSKIERLGTRLVRFSGFRRRMILTTLGIVVPAWPIVVWTGNGQVSSYFPEKL